MTNAEAAAHFASLPPTEQALVILINGDTSSADYLFLCEPGTNLEEVDQDCLDDGDERLATTFHKW